MDIFKIIDGRHTLDGNGGVVRIESVETGRNGVPRVKTLLSNGGSVALVYRGEQTLAIVFINGKGARFVRVAGDDVLNFYVDGVLVATVGAADIESFTAV